MGNIKHEIGLLACRRDMCDTTSLPFATKHQTSNAQSLATIANNLMCVYENDKSAYDFVMRSIPLQNCTTNRKFIFFLLMGWVVVMVMAMINAYATSSYPFFHFTPSLMLWIFPFFSHIIFYISHLCASFLILYWCFLSTSWEHHIDDPIGDEIEGSMCCRYTGTLYGAVKPMSFDPFGREKA